MDYISHLKETMATTVVYMDTTELAKHNSVGGTSVNIEGRLKALRFKAF